MRPAFEGEVEVTAAAWSLSSGRTVDFRLVEPREPHPFKAFTKRRGDKAGTRFNGALIRSDDVTNTPIVMELMLAGWRDEPKGQSVRFFLGEDGEHPFSGCSTPSGKTPGTRFSMALAELSDDERPVDQERREKVEASHAKEEAKKPNRIPRRLSQQAHLMVTGPLFVQWLTAVQNPPAGHRAWTADLARAYVKHVLNVDSLSALDDAEVAKRFHEQVRRPFAAWCDAHV